MKILITGVNGFIGNWLARTLLEDPKKEVVGIDLHTHNIQTQEQSLLDKKNFTFLKLDLLDPKNKPQIESHVQACDIILPLAAIANPYFYVKDPLGVFELDFMHNLEIIKWTVAYKKRLIFPSSSEVYGMSTEAEFEEDSTKLVLGPVEKMRWIYSSSKQLLDRVICAYGLHQELSYTIFRPFNWMGPRLDDVGSQKEGESRAITQFINNALNGRPIQIVNGGNQRRCFIYIDDAINALLKIIENENQCAKNTVFNIGNPENDISIRELAELTLRLVQNIPHLKALTQNAHIQPITSENYFGSSYEDVHRRIPSIKKAKDLLNWEPKVSMEESLQKTLEYYLSHPNSPVVPHLKQA